MRARSRAGAVALAGLVFAGCSRPGGRTRVAHDAPIAATSATPSARAAQEAHDAPSVVVDTGPITRVDVERDLSLEMVHGSGPIEIGRDADLKVVLVNRSASRTYPVVLSSDGSDDPVMREPHVWYTVERRNGSGVWQPAEYTARRICGNFDEDWTKDLIELRPGQRVTLPWFDFRPGFWKLDDTTAIRVVAHYSYGEHDKSDETIPAALQAMPAYALASAPLELPLDAPLRLELRVLGPIPRRPGLPLAGVFDVVAVNQWKDPLPFSTPEAGGAHLHFKIEYEETKGRVEQFHFSTQPGNNDAAKDRIAPGERRAVVAASARTDDTWEFSRRTRLRRVRAVLSVYESGDERSVLSPWVDIEPRVKR